MNERSCCKPNCPQPQPMPTGGMAYALYHQNNILSNNAPFDGIALSETAAESFGDFYSDGSSFQILKPGVYLISYIVNIPAAVAVNTTICTAGKSAERAKHCAQCGQNCHRHTAHNYRSDNCGNQHPGGFAFIVIQFADHHRHCPVETLASLSIQQRHATV